MNYDRESFPNYEVACEEYSRFNPTKPPALSRYEIKSIVDKNIVCRDYDFAVDFGFPHIEPWPTIDSVIRRPDRESDNRYKEEKSGYGLRLYHASEGRELDFEAGSRIEGYAKHTDGFVTIVRPRTHMIPTKIMFRYIVPCIALNARDVAKMVASLVISMEAHEVCENLYLDGERILDPHAYNNPDTSWLLNNLDHALARGFHD